MLFIKIKQIAYLATTLRARYIINFKELQILSPMMAAYRLALKSKTNYSTLKLSL
jgi:hypothetical protein